MLFSLVLLLGPAAGLASAQEPAGDRAGHEAAADSLSRVRIGAVQVEGNVRQTRAEVLARARLREGITVTYRDIQSAIRRLWRTGQYSDVRIYARAPEGAAPRAPVTLVIKVEERPQVAAIEFRGLEHIDGGTIRDTVGLRPGGPLEPAKIAEAEAMIRQLLAGKGYRVRRIDHHLEELPGDTKGSRLVFEVEEGQRVAIAEIVFKGNESFTDAELRAAMEADAEGFFWFQQGTYKPGVVRKDLRERLPAFYGKHGYIDFGVIEDTLVVDPETGKARLIVRVSEGRQYRLADFRIEGNRRFPTKRLKRYFKNESSGLLAGLGFGEEEQTDGASVFNRVAFRQATKRLDQLYRNHGYLYAQVTPVIERTQTDSGRPAVRAIWRIQEGQPAYVNRVKIAGNTYTHERVIRKRITLLPGDIYSEQRLIRSYRRIAGLGFFKTPLPMPDIQPTEDGDVNVTFHVEEKQTGSINFGTALGGIGGIAGFLGYKQPNLFGQGESGQIRLEFGRFRNNIQASYRDPSIMQSRVSGSVSVFSRKNTRFFQLAGGDFRRTGASLSLGFPVPNARWTRVQLGYSLVHTTYSAAAGVGASSIFRLPPGTRSSISLGLVRNTLNHPLFPTVGTRHEIEAQFTGGPLGGDGNYQKYTAEGSWWVPIGEIGGDAPGDRPIRMTLGLSVSAGAITGSAARFPLDRFTMGGVRFGQTLRGYQERTITPLGYVAPPGQGGGVPFGERLGNAFLRLTAQYAIRLNNRLSLAFFYDAGNIWREPSAFNPTRLRRGAGVGVTLVTPFGPLGLDYAYGFDKPNPGWQLHFKLGPTF